MDKKEELNIVGRLERLSPNEMVSIVTYLQEDLYNACEENDTLYDTLSEFMKRQMSVYCSDGDNTEHRVSLRVRVVSIGYEVVHSFELFYVYRRSHEKDVQDYLELA